MPTSTSRLDKFLLPLLLLLAALFAARPLMSFDDFWNHAAVGRWILENGQIPRETLFLWTAKQQWVAHSWGTQLWFALLMRAGEEAGPLLGRAFAALMTGASIAVLWRLWRRQNGAPLLAGLAFLLAIGAAHWRFEARPELFTALFLSLLLSYLIGRDESRWGQASVPAVGRRPTSQSVEVPLRATAGTEACPHRTKTIVRDFSLIITLFIVWANVHGAFAIGLVTLLLTLIGDAVQDKFNRRAQGLLLLFLACAAATLINPYGIELHRALRQVNSYTFAFLDEWKPPLANPPLPLIWLAPQAVLGALALLSWALNPRRRWAHILWLGFWIYSFCGARRHAWMLAIVCLAVLAANSGAWENLRAKLQWTPQKGSMARGALLLAWLGVFVTGPLSVLLNVSSDAPKKLCDVWDEFNPPGRLYNGFINAAYLAWRCGGKRPLFIDHLQAHPDSLLVDYNDITSATPRGLKLLDEMKIGYATLRNPGDPRLGPPLMRYLHASPDWEMVFFDENAILWVRRTPEYAALRAAKSRFVPAELR